MDKTEGKWLDTLIDAGYELKKNVVHTWVRHFYVAGHCHTTFTTCRVKRVD